MVDTLLEEILQLERSLAAELAAERQKAAAWLAGRQAALVAVSKCQPAPADGPLLTTKKRRQLRQMAAAELYRGRLRLRQLTDFADDRLRVRLRAALTPVIGDRTHDRPDGED